MTRRMTCRYRRRRTPGVAYRCRPGVCRWGMFTGVRIDPGASLSWFGGTAGGEVAVCDWAWCGGRFCWIPVGPGVDLVCRLEGTAPNRRGRED